MGMNRDDQSTVHKETVRIRVNFKIALKWM